MLQYRSSSSVSSCRTPKNFTPFFPPPPAAPPPADTAATTEKALEEARAFSAAAGDTVGTHGGDVRQGAQPDRTSPARTSSRDQGDRVTSCISDATNDALILQMPDIEWGVVGRVVMMMNHSFPGSPTREIELVRNVECD